MLGKEEREEGYDDGEKDSAMPVARAEEGDAGDGKLEGDSEIVS